MKDNEEYVFNYEGNRIIIKTGKAIDVDGGIVYCAYTRFKKLNALAECKEKALENCVKRIKFAVMLSKRKVKLINRNQATILAKKYFSDNYTNKSLIKDRYKTLSYSVFVEDDILTFTVLGSLSCNSTSDDKLDTIAFIFVNLLTGECDMIENKLQ